ncbi:MAG: gluconokinase [Clostridia bacterium]|nr:gluconokinase [Clostridia bacterium]
MGEGYIGVDIGTSSIRAALFDIDGYQKYISSRECTVLSKENGLAELDAAVLFYQTITVIKDCTDFAGANNVSVNGIGLSCQMHSLLTVDKSGEPLTAVMIWADARAVKEAASIKENFDSIELYRITGCRLQHPMYPASKIIWIKNNCPDVFSKTYKFITIKEYIIFRLFGEYIVDYTLAGCQGYFNIHSFEWDGFILGDILGIGKDRLSEPAECTFCLKGMNAEYARAMGLSADTPVVIGSGDGIMANLGSGVVNDSAFSSTIGTSGALRTSVNKPLLAAEQQTWCYPFLKNTWVAGGAINNGGIVLKWIRDEFEKQFIDEAHGSNVSIYKLFDRYASEIAAGSNGLFFLPYLAGERSPDWNPEVRGTMYGLSLIHGRKHIVRAAMEGVLYRLFSIYEILSDMNRTASKIIASGGYAKSKVWLQMQADIFNKEILVAPVTEASALGAAYLAMVAVGAANGFDNMLPSMKPRSIITPDAETHKFYTHAYKRAMEIYSNLYYK